MGDLHVDDANNSGTSVINVTRGLVNNLIASTSTKGLIGMASDHDLDFITDNQVRMSITSGGLVDIPGNLGVGNTIQTSTINYPNGTLRSLSTGLLLSGLGGNVSINGGFPSARLGIGIGGSSATATVDIAGTIRVRSLPSGGSLDIQADANGNLFRQSSDKRLKENIRDIKGSLKKVQSIRSVKFDWKDDGAKNQFGFIAQELQAVLPEVVNENPDGYLGVDYSEMIPILVDAIKEQQKIIENLQSSNTQLIAGFKALEDEMSANKKVSVD